MHCKVIQAISPLRHIWSGNIEIQDEIQDETDGSTLKPIDRGPHDDGFSR